MPAHLSGGGNGGRDAKPIVNYTTDDLPHQGPGLFSFVLTLDFISAIIFRQRPNNASCKNLGS
jgi:hypothetical protein